MFRAALLCSLYLSQFVDILIFCATLLSIFHYNFFCNINTQMAMIDDLHINAENIDVRWEKETNKKINILAFLSRHKAASGTPSLTVHPIGNWGVAEYGGSDNDVSHTSPSEMSGLLFELYKTAPDGYQICLEATHHGPYVETPTFFIEIGSSPDRWELKEPAEAIAECNTGRQDRH